MAPVRNLHAANRGPQAVTERCRRTVALQADRSVTGGERREKRLKNGMESDALGPTTGGLDPTEMRATTKDMNGTRLKGSMGYLKRFPDWSTSGLEAAPSQRAAQLRASLPCSHQLEPDARVDGYLHLHRMGF